MGKRKKWKPKAERDRILRILGTPTSQKDRRGFEAEEKAFAALEYHQEKRTEFPGKRKIRQIRPSCHYSLEDCLGVDISCQLESPQGIETLEIQVQNWGGRGSEERFLERGICLIVISPKCDKKRSQEIVFRTIDGWFSRN